MRLVVGFLVFAAGFGLVNVPITYGAVSGMPAAQAGVAAAVASTSRQVGATLGVAVTGTVLAAGVTSSFSADFVSASRPAWLIIAGCGLAVLVLGAVTTGRAAQRTATRTAELIRNEPTLEPAAR